MANLAHGGMNPRVDKAKMPSAPKKELEHIRVSMAENGGHVAEHHYTSFEHPPEQHVFGEGQGKELLEHIGKHMGVKAEAKAEKEPLEQEEEEEEA